MGISDLEATSRFAATRRDGGPQRAPSFLAMVITEWHKLIADVSRAFARRRIHRTATQCRHNTALVVPLDTPKRKLFD